MCQWKFFLDTAISSQAGSGMHCPDGGGGRLGYLQLSEKVSLARTDGPWAKKDSVA